MLRSAVCAARRCGRSFIGRCPFRRFCALLIIVFLACAAAAQPASSPATTEQLELIARATQNELDALEDPAPFRYQERLEWSWGTETRSVIETPEGRADRI